MPTPSDRMWSSVTADLDPGSQAGQHLIAHELAHTIQQRSAGFMATGDGSAREREADRAAQHVATGRTVPTLTRSGLGVSCQLHGQIPRGRAEIDVQILLVTSQLRLPVLPPPMRALLLHRLHQLQVARARFGGVARSQPATPSAGEVATAQARADALKQHIDNHPAWSFAGGTGTPEGYAEIEANTSGADFERTDLFRDWYIPGLGSDSRSSRPRQGSEDAGIQPDHGRRTAE